jgi:hypothetical protein
MKVDEKAVDWNIINNIVRPEHQYREVLAPPLDAVRMAWPFKTEDELKILSKWFKQEEKRTKQSELAKVGKALI